MFVSIIGVDEVRVGDRDISPQFLFSLYFAQKIQAAGMWQRGQISTIVHPHHSYYLFVRLKFSWW